MDVLRPVDRIGVPSWITNHYCKQLVHKWRTEEDAFMVGKHTAIMDNPQLTVREWTGRNPKRICVDYDDNLPDELAIFDGASECILFNGKRTEKVESITRIKIQSRKDNLSEILRHIHHEQIQSLVVEGGAELLNQFIDAGLWDEARIFTGGLHFKEGIKAPQIRGVNEKVQVFGNSRLKILYQKA